MSVQTPVIFFKAVSPLGKAVYVGKGKGICERKCKSGEGLNTHHLTLEPLVKRGNIQNLTKGKSNN